MLGAIKNNILFNFLQKDDLYLVIRMRVTILLMDCFKIVRDPRAVVAN